MSNKRKLILIELKEQIESLVVNGKRLNAGNRHINPRDNTSRLPYFAVVPSIEELFIEMSGDRMSRRLPVEVFGVAYARNISIKDDALFSDSEDYIDAIVKHFISESYAARACSFFDDRGFVISHIGPVLVESLEDEEYFTYISIPIVVEFIDDNIIGG